MRPGRAGTIALLAVSLVGCAGDLGDPPVPTDFDTLEAPIIARIRAALDQVADERGSVEARIELGMVYAANALFESARSAFEQATAAGKADARGWYYLALVRADLGDLDGAIAAMEQAGNRESDYAPIHWQLGLWHLDRSDMAAAEGAFREGTAIDPADQTALLGMARVRLRQGNPQTAASILEPLCEQDSGGSYARHLLSMAYARLGRDDDARRVARAGMGGGRLQLSDPWRDEMEIYAVGYKAQLDRSQTRARSGDYAGALEILEDLRHGGEKTIEVRNNLGMCYLALSRHDDAVRILEDAVDYNPNSLQAQHMLAGAYWMRSRGAEGADLNRQLRNVLRCVERTLAIDPAFVPSLALRGDVLSSVGNHREALVAYEEAARWDHDQTDWLLQVAVTQGRLGDFDAAAGTLLRVLEIDSMNTEALGRLGLAYMRLRRLGEAEAAFLRARASSSEPDPQIERAIRQVQLMRRGGGP